MFPEDACLNSVSVTPQEVKSVLQTLKLGKSWGPDNVNYKILKELQFRFRNHYLNSLTAL